MTPDELASVASWARNLSDAEVGRVAPVMRLRQLNRGEHLMHLDDVVDAWHGAVSGVLRVGMVSNDGQIAGFSAVLGGAWFGEGRCSRTSRAAMTLLP
jgi:CRP/FNR family cyclic AMP-dependent transcriptional regulator